MFQMLGRMAVSSNDPESIYLKEIIDEFSVPDPLDTDKDVYLEASRRKFFEKTFCKKPN